MTKEQISKEFGGTTAHVLLDVQSGALWDSVELKAGETFRSRTILFDRPLDGRRQLTDTNMRTAKMLPPPESLCVRRIVFTFAKYVSDVDLYGVAERMTFKFLLGQKIQVCSPIIALQTIKNVGAPIRICDFCRAVYCGDQSCPGCGARQFTCSSFGEDVESGTQFYMDLLINIVISDRMSFYVEFEGENYTLQTESLGGKGLRMWCHLEGLHARGVQ